MATYTPPPYFPQGSLAPPDKGRYRRFKLLMTLLALLVVAIVGAAVYGLWYLIKWVM
jgi:hypothetical protein